MTLFVSVALTVFAVGSAFAPVRNIQCQNRGVVLSSSATTSNTENFDFVDWAQDNGIILSNKLLIRDTTEEERGKGGVEAMDTIQPLEILATIPRSLLISDVPERAMEAAANAKNFSWVVDLTAATLAALHPTDDNDVLQPWVSSWKDGGWATQSSDLGPPDANFGPKAVTGSLLATGSDNDHNIYAKFRMPCHPVVFRASRGLAMLTGCNEDEALDALTCRGRHYRSMRDALECLVLEPSAERTKGSNREKRCWDVADTLSRVLSRATMIQLDNNGGGDIKTTQVAAIVPLHEGLAHSNTENAKLVVDEENVLLVATQEISKGSPITRNYSLAPRLDQDDSQGALHLLLQFGLPPNAW